MKKMIYSALAIAAMVSCTSQEELIEEGDLVEIKLQAGISAIETKAALDANSALDAFTLLRYDATTEPTDFTTEHKVIQDASLNGNTITLATPEYYNIDAAQNTYFVGFYPKVSNVTTTTKEVTIDIDGKTDILACDVFNAGNKTTQTSSGITFKHMLTQFVIKIAGDAASKEYFGQVTSIKIKAQANSGKLTLGVTSSLVPEGSADIPVYKADAEAPAMDIPTTAGDFGYALIAPNTNESADYTLSVKTEKLSTPASVTVTVTKAGVDTHAAPAGKKVVITLTFSQKEIAGTGAIANWEDAGTGNGTVY